MAQNPRSEERLVRLDEARDLKIAEGERDPTGWEVVAADRETIGVVDDLVVDNVAMKARYLVCALDREDRRILIPIDLARLNPEEEVVNVDAIASGDVSRVPEYTGEPIRPEFEERVRAAFRAPAEAVPEREGRELRLTRAEEEVAVGTREVSAGEVEIDKTVETERVRRPVRLRHEEVEIERRPATGARAGEARIEEEEIHVPVTEEEAVVQKRPVVKEELVVKKRPVEETKEVEAEVQRERIDVESERRGREGRRGRGRR